MRKIILAVALAMFSTAAMAQTVPVEGKVKKINEAQGKITLKHDEIANLDMGAMTMVFAIDPEVLKTVKVGDMVTFEADRVNGKLTVVKLDKRS
ncbi:copper-binding protein [Devosia psychrophila]|uniref:Cu and Ag efflux protein CusF n=1 Tax=Devosia psychrophila TaxID=728005 RepID=A0A0F5Q1I0_9HYPH|nr:copper-binding protein [Devosia psychrophila]KKC34496.1 RND transporter [Devosia psychrophila]SFD39076.1 Cu and Ag efflux protein CusF [Devosia psychrophila]